MIEFFKNYMSSYIGQAWKKILIFSLVPFVYLFSWGIVKTISLIVFIGAYFTIMGMGIYDDIMSGSNASVVSNIVKKYTGDKNGHTENN